MSDGSIQPFSVIFENYFLHLLSILLRNDNFFLLER